MPLTEGVRHRVREFLYFYDFYIFSSVLLIAVTVYLVASS